MTGLAKPSVSPGASAGEPRAVVTGADGGSANGGPPQARRLIVNADDFGQSHGLNRGVIEAFEHGIVTSASLMVRWPAATEAAAYARRHPDLSLGLHVDLGEWAYRDETWVPVYQVVATDDAVAVAAEIQRQVAVFHQLVGHDPTHLDSHQHVHREEPVGAILRDLAREIGVPLRQVSPSIQYRGDFYGQTGRGESYPAAITVDALAAVLAGLPAGTTELGCHPGYGDDLDSAYRQERAEEVRVLCDPRIAAVIRHEGIVLCSFHDVVTDEP